MITLLHNNNNSKSLLITLLHNNNNTKSLSITFLYNNDNLGPRLCPQGEIDWTMAIHGLFISSTVYMRLTLPRDWLNMREHWNCRIWQKIQMYVIILKDGLGIKWDHHGQGILLITGDVYNMCECTCLQARYLCEFSGLCCIRTRSFTIFIFAARTNHYNSLLHSNRYP